MKPDLLFATAAVAIAGAAASSDHHATAQAADPPAIVSEVFDAPCCDDDPPTPPGEIDEVKQDALWLARTYVHEHGWPHVRRSRAGKRQWRLDDEMPALDAVLERVRRARERSPRFHDPTFEGACLAYSHGLAESDAAALTLEGDAPLWRSYIPWRNRRDAWLISVAHAIDVRLGLVEHRCTVPPMHWGCGPEQSTPPRGTGTCRDHERAARYGLCEINCGSTVDTFYAECD